MTRQSPQLLSILDPSGERVEGDTETRERETEREREGGGKEMGFILNSSRNTLESDTSRLMQPQRIVSDSDLPGGV